eukprot:symbB.v1.2.001748.t2/scaffold94.1/size335129/12
MLGSLTVFLLVFRMNQSMARNNEAEERTDAMFGEMDYLAHSVCHFMAGAREDHLHDLLLHPNVQFTEDEIKMLRLHGELASIVRVHVVRLTVAFGVSCLLYFRLLTALAEVQGELEEEEKMMNEMTCGVITLDIPITATVRELKAMLLEKHPCQDPIERKILKVELLRDSSIIDDAETLDAAGLFCTESLVTVAYARNEVEAATKDDIDHIHTQRFFGVKIPCNLTEISRYAFQNCKLLVLVTISGSVTHIGCHAFAGCTSLTSISISESVTHIGACAFAGCTSLNRISMGESVTHIERDAFAACRSLRSIIIGESVTHIGVGVFAGCTSLMSISIGESVSHIWERAFAGCTSLRSVTMGESVTHIGTGSGYLKIPGLGPKSIKVLQDLVQIIFLHSRLQSLLYEEEMEIIDRYMCISRESDKQGEAEYRAEVNRFRIARQRAGLLLRPRVAGDLSDEGCQFVAQSSDIVPPLPKVVLSMLMEACHLPMGQKWGYHERVLTIISSICADALDQLTHLSGLIFRPVSLAYYQHCRVIVVIFSFMWPLVTALGEDNLGSVFDNVIFPFVVYWAMSGLERLAEMMENPVGDDDTDINLYQQLHQLEVHGSSRFAWCRGFAG